MLTVFVSKSPSASSAAPNAPPLAHTRAVRAENLHDAGFLTTI